ncbi:uncharacterized protein [Dermacentor andersoni]|uniref:uncharacterized protein n=1 Tax=Dermacentor andersoni TaxID=34620 RepID=UPI002417A1DC|nr:uncharacterized protein LOC129383869 [Dermacentor andersoni]
MLGTGRQVLHRACDSVSGVNWRPTRFVDEPVAARYACCVCHLIPTTTVLLPCGHALCDQCQRGSVTQDGGSVCPLDGEPFCEDECQKLQLQERRKQKLEAHCWNEVHGCDFVGPLAALLGHFEAECAFHVLPCERCGETVRNSELAAHYIGGCSNALSSVTLAESSQKSGTVVTSGDVTTVGREIDKSAANTCEDAMPALQSQVNEFTEAARIQGAQLQELNAALAARLDSLNANVALAAQKFSETIGEASQMQKRMLDWQVGISCLTRKGVAGSPSESMHLPEVTSTLQNLEHFAGESLRCLERLLQAQMKESHPIVQLFLLPRRIDEPVEGCAMSSLSSCTKVNETVYHMILSKLSSNLDVAFPPRLHRRDVWFRVTFNDYEDRRTCRKSICMTITWICKKENMSNLPKVVSVIKVNRGNSNILRNFGSKDWQQQYCLGELYQLENEAFWVFEIVIHD